MENVEPLIKPPRFEERLALDQRVESHIEREVEYIVNQYRQHIAKFDKDWFIVLTHPKSLCLIYDSESRWECKYSDIIKEIQDRADKIMREMGYEGYKGYNLKLKSSMRKTAEDVINRFINEENVRFNQEHDDWMLEAMREFSSQEVEYAVEKALAMAAEKAKNKRIKTNHPEVSFNAIDKSSILSLKEQVLKELKEGI